MAKLGEQAAFDQRMRIVAQDVAVLAGAGLRFVGIDDELMLGRPSLTPSFGMKDHFRRGRETGAAAATQAGGLHLLDDPVPDPCR
jgi:hypothetical protein